MLISFTSVVTYVGASNSVGLSGAPGDVVAVNAQSTLLTIHSKYSKSSGIPLSPVKGTVALNVTLKESAIGSPGLNHVAIFLDGDVLHHLTDRLSCREPYSQWLLKCTGGRYRYVA